MKTGLCNSLSCPMDAGRGNAGGFSNSKGYKNNRKSYKSSDLDRQQRPFEEFGLVKWVVTGRFGL